MTQNPIVIKSTSEGVLTLLNAKGVFRLSSSKNVQYLYAPFSLTNTIKVGFLLANGVNVPFRKITPSSAVTLQGLIDTGNLPEGDVEEDFLLWEYSIPQSILNAVAQKNASEFITSYTESEIVTDTDYLGYYTTVTEVTATINAELKVEFPLATTGQWSNVWQETSNTFFSWLFDGADFVKQTSILNEQFIGTTGQLTLAVNASVASDDELIDVTVTDIVFDELSQLWVQTNANKDNLVNKDLTTYTLETTIEDNFKLFVNDSGGNPKHVTVGELITDTATKFTTITLLDGTGNNAVGSYDGTNITWLIQPEGTQETVNAEMFKNLFVQVTCSADINSGDFVQFDGVIGVSGKVKGKPFVPSELNIQPSLILGVATQSGTALGNQEVLVNWYGVVNDLDTSLVAEEDILYAKTDGTDGVDNGKWTNVAPMAPNAQIRVAAVATSHATQGAILVRPDFGLALGELHDVYLNGGRIDGATIVFNNANQRYEQIHLRNNFADKAIQNGQFKESFDFKYNSVSSVFSLINADLVTDSLTMQFSDGETSLDTTALTIAPTFGTATVPQGNWYYIPLSTKLLTKSTTQFPTDQHIKIAFVNLFDEITTDADLGSLVNQNHNNHVSGSDLMGALQHIRARLRKFGASYDSGVAGAGNNGWLDDSTVAGTHYWKSGSGVVWQLHPQTFMAQDTETGSDIHVVNDNTTPYNDITTINEITELSDGVAIGNGYFNIVVFGVVNKTGEYSPLLLNLPTGKYTGEDDAKADVNQTAVYDLPRAFTKDAGVSFPIARITMRKLGLVYTFIQSVDLRNTTSVLGGGGSSAQDTSFIDSVFEVTNLADNTKVIKFDAGTISTGNTRTLTAQDKDYTIADEADVVVLEQFKAEVEFNLTNDVVNGNFVSTANWVASGSTLLASSNVLSITGDGTIIDPKTYQVIGNKTIGDKLLINAKVKVTNSDATKIWVYLSNNAGGGFLQLVKQILTPTINVEYEINEIVTLETTNDYRLYIGAVYADAGTASGKVLQAEYVLSENLTTDFGVADVPTLELINSIYSIYENNWFEGVSNSLEGKYTVITTNENEIINDKALAFEGDVLFANLPTGIQKTGNTYKVTDDFVYDNTFVNVATNGYFKSGTTGWNATGSTNTESEENLLNEGVGTSTQPRASQNPFTVAKTYRVKARMRMIDSGAGFIGLQNGSTNLELQVPVLNQWYELITFVTATSTELRLTHFYTLSGDSLNKTMEVDYVEITDLDQMVTDGDINFPTEAEYDAWLIKEKTFKAGTSVYWNNTTWNILANHEVMYNPLFNKTIIYKGDSILLGDSNDSSNLNGWTGRITNKNHMTMTNASVDGAFITDTENVGHHRIVLNISSLSNTTDYMILEGGANDYFNTITLGSISSGYSAVLDITTFAGAFESCLKQILIKYPDKKTGYIIPYKLLTADLDRTGQEVYFQMARDICDKWSFPYLDLSKTSGLDYNVLPAYFVDSVHINSDGYDVTFEKVEAWLKTL